MTRNWNGYWINTGKQMGAPSNRGRQRPLSAQNV